MLFATDLNDIQMSFFSKLLERMQEGGIVVMSIVLISGLIALFLFFRSLFFVKNRNPKLNKMIVLINSIGLFALVTGVFGQLLQLINTLDYFEFREVLTAEELASGLKFTILPTLFGCFIFLISRFFTITLNWLKPHNMVD